VNRALTDLDLSWNGLSYNGSVALRRTLSINKTLRNLYASNCNIDWINAKLISEGLAKNNTLRVLNVRATSQGRRGETSGVVCLARIQSFNNSWSGISHASDDGQVQWSIVTRRFGRVASRSLGDKERIRVF
jgi:hypothetical protein